jgi:hypothetical protein
MRSQTWRQTRFRWPLQLGTRRALRCGVPHKENDMNAKTAVLFLVLDAFLLLNGWALYQFGLVKLFAAVLENQAAWVFVADLVISLSLVTVWMVNDAQKRRTSLLPYVLITMTLGSIGPLLYLIRREWSASRAQTVRA